MLDNVSCSQCGLLHPPIPGGGDCPVAKEMQMKNTSKGNDISTVVALINKYLYDDENYKEKLILLQKFFGLMISKNLKEKEKFEKIRDLLV